MGIATITQKHVRLLKQVADRGPVIASWQHQDLCDLWRMGLVDKLNAFSVNGRPSSNSIWTASIRGLSFLHDDRGGQ